MDNVKNSETLDITNAFFDSAFTDIDLNSSMEKIYEIIDNDRLQAEFEKQVNLTKLRNENYTRYNQINISKYKNLPDELSEYALSIINLYGQIDVKNILTDNYEDSKKSKEKLDNISLKITKLENMISSYLKEVIIKNNENQSKFSITYFKNLDVDEKTKQELINRYDDLILCSALIPKDIYEELRIQERRKEYINEIFKKVKTANKQTLNLLSQDKIQLLNVSINLEIQKYKERIGYLEDLIPEHSKYLDEFNEFKDFFNRLIAYDDESYENTKQIFEILTDSTKVQNRIDTLENLFIDERDSLRRESKFVYEKIGIKNLKSSLNYITANYVAKLSEENKKVIEYIHEQLNGNSYDLDELNRTLKSVVKAIWKEQITDVYSFDPDEDYYFICSNNQFIDEKYETILITKKELDRVDDYEDYQIGFICPYNDNILYITENEDIMTVKDDDMSDLKTPIQIEQEFVNFKVCNRIALNGHITSIQAVYLINDGNMEKYLKAVELANMYKLPLIELKKSTD